MKSECPNCGCREEKEEKFYHPKKIETYCRCAECSMLLGAGEIYSWQVKNENMSNNGKAGNKCNGAGKR